MVIANNVVNQNQEGWILPHVKGKVDKTIKRSDKRTSNEVWGTQASNLLHSSHIEQLHLI